MNEERRANSVETVLLKLGELSEASKDIKQTVSDLKDRVGIQNGRVGKLEKWQSFMQGVIAVLVLMVIPVVVEWLKGVLIH